MNADWLNPLVEQLGWTLLHFLWQGALIGALFGLGLFLLRDAAAGSRYALAVGALTLLALLPPATFFYLSADVGTTASGAISDPAWMVVAVNGPNVTAAVKPDLLLWVVAAWLTGVLIMTARLWLGWRHLVRLRSGADTSAALSLRPVVEQLCRGIGIARSVQVALSRQVRSPVVIGWLKPLILLPPAVINRLPRDQIEMVLAHEVAHIRRHDHLVNLFQTVVETVLFYHPVVAWVSRRIRVERENACDDLVVQSTGDRLAYVEMLAGLERMRFQGPRLALAMNDGQVLGRIRRLVEQSRPRRQRGVVIPAMLLSATLAAGIGISLVADDPGAEPDLSALIAGQQSERVTENPARPAPSVEQPTVSPPSTRPETSGDAGALQAHTVDPEPSTVRGVASTDSTTSEAPAIAADRAAPDRVEPASPERQAVTDAPTPPSAAPQRVASGPASTPQAEPAQGEVVPQTGAETSAGEALQMAVLPRNPARNLERAVRSEESIVSLEPAPITGGDLIRRIEPVYPGRAHRRLTDGLVELEFVVGRDGRVDDIEILRETPQRWRFGEAAAAAVAQWRFEPYRRADEPLERTVRVEVVFEPDRSTCPARTGTRIPNC